MQTIWTKIMYTPCELKMGINNDPLDSIQSISILVFPAIEFWRWLSLPMHHVVFSKLYYFLLRDGEICSWIATICWWQWIEDESSRDEHVVTKCPITKKETLCFSTSISSSLHTRATFFLKGYPIPFVLGHLLSGTISQVSAKHLKKGHRVW